MNKKITIIIIAIFVVIMAALMYDMASRQYATRQSGDSVAPPVISKKDVVPNQNQGQDRRNPDRGNAAAIANPAAKYCTDQGNKYEILTNADGSQSGYCILNEAVECEEWAYYKKECPRKEGKAIVKNNKLYNDLGEERGTIKGSEMSVFVGATVVTFQGDVDKLHFRTLWPGLNHFEYDGLEISDVAMCLHPDEEVKTIKYECSSPLCSYDETVDLSDGDDFEQAHIKGDTYFHCDTNGDNYLSQYEFGSFNGIPFGGTGGGFSEGWNKVYIKKSGGQNIFFFGALGKYATLLDHPPAVQNYISQRDKVIAQSYLDAILKNSEIANQVTRWDKFVKEATFSTRQSQL